MPDRWNARRLAGNCGAFCCFELPFHCISANPTDRSPGQGTQCRRAAPDRPLGGRFFTVSRFITHTPKTRNKVASTHGSMPPAVGRCPMWLWWHVPPPQPCSPRRTVMPSRPWCGAGGVTMSTSTPPLTHGPGHVRSYRPVLACGHWPDGTGRRFQSRVERRARSQPL